MVKPKSPIGLLLKIIFILLVFVTVSCGYFLIRILIIGNTLVIKVTLFPLLFTFLCSTISAVWVWLTIRNRLTFPKKLANFPWMEILFILLVFSILNRLFSFYNLCQGGESFWPKKARLIFLGLAPLLVATICVAISIYKSSKKQPKNF